MGYVCCVSVTHLNSKGASPERKKTSRFKLKKMGINAGHLTADHFWREGRLITLSHGPVSLKVIINHEHRLA